MTLLSSGIQKHTTYNCYEEVQAMVGRYCGSDISLCFLASFGFRYHRNNAEGLSLESACVSNGGENKELFMPLCELKHDFLAFDESTIGSVIGRCIRKSEPIALAIDSYYLPWNKYYLRGHRFHLFLISEIIDNKYVCLDPFLSTCETQLEEKTAHRHCLNLLKFSQRQHFTKPSLHHILDTLQAYLSHNKADHINGIKLFAQDILGLRFPVSIHGNYDVNMSELFFRLTLIHWGRINFISTIDSIAQRYETSLFEGIVSELKDAKDAWERVKNLLIKSFYSKNKGPCLEKMSRLLLDIAAKEEAVIEYLTLINRLKEDNSHEN